jgi:hypothetical protein
MSDESLLVSMRAHRSLIDGPIAVKGDRAMVGRPPELLVKLLVPALPPGVSQDDFMRIVIRGQVSERFTSKR